VPGRFFVDTEGGDKVAENPEGDPRNALAGERTSFAKFRTSLALDRTTLAWIRTTLTFATFGLGMIGYFRAVRQATQDERAVRLHQAAITWLSDHGDRTRSVLPLDGTAQIAPRGATRHISMAFDHHHRCTHFNSRALRALVGLRSMRLIDPKSVKTDSCGTPTSRRA
jgi:hypothetical protein